MKAICHYDTKVNVPEYMIKGGVTYRLITDQLGSVRLVVNASTGGVAQRIDYDEFGVATLVTGTWDFQPFGFAGGLYVTVRPTASGQAIPAGA